MSEKSTRAGMLEGRLFDLQQFAAAQDDQAGASGPEGDPPDPWAGTGDGEPAGAEGATPKVGHVWDEETGGLKEVPIEEAKRGYMGQRETTKRFEESAKRDAALKVKEAELMQNEDFLRARELMRANPKLGQRVMEELRRQQATAGTQGSPEGLVKVEERMKKLEVGQQAQAQYEVNKEKQTLQETVSMVEGRAMSDEEAQGVVDYCLEHGYGGLSQSYNHMQLEKGKVKGLGPLARTPARVGTSVAGAQEKELTTEQLGKMSSWDVFQWRRRNGLVNETDLKGGL